MVSSSNILGDSDPNVSLTFTVSPVFTVSKTGKGMIQIKIPFWYKVGSRNNMMFNEQDRNSCSSDDFYVVSSSPSLLLGTLTIMYQDLVESKRAGLEPIVFKCRGFRNPIVPVSWPGFRVTFYDSQFQDENNPSPN
jgi:hypothetical protein